MKTLLYPAMLGCVLGLPCTRLSAQVPTLLNYQGRVAVNGVNFEGSGTFKFALVDGGVNQSVTATATAMIAGLGDGMGPRVIAINIVNGGSGYTSPPAVTIFHPIGSGAAATATVTGGVVTAITVTANGLNYGSGPTTVTIDPPPPNIEPSVSYWSNDGSSVAASEPAAAVTLTVTKGLYSVLLGDTGLANMAAIPATAFANPDVRLRVWFDDGVTGSQLLTPDQRLAPTAYLADGSVTSAALADGSVVAAKIAPGTITGSKIAPGTLDFSHLAVPAAPGAGQVLGFDGANLTWTAPGGGGGVWALNGSSTYYNAGNVGIGSSAPVGKLEVVGQDALRLIGFNPFFTIYDSNAGYARSRIQGVGGDISLFTETYLNGSNPLAFLKLANNGNVGIGSAVPVGKLEVVAQDALRLIGYQPFLTLLDSNAGYSRSRIQSVAGNITLETESFVNGSNPNNYALLNSAGNFSVKSLTIRGGADLAEPFALSERDVPAGAVVSIDPLHPGKLKMSTSAYDRKVAGIVSGANGIHPGISMIQEDALEAGENVALSGRVYVRADTSAGAIEPGDFLTTSGRPGQAMKASDHERSQGAILGKAMTALADGDGLVLVLVTLQ